MKATADTIEELADKAGINKDELVKTVAQWNQYCEDGYDPAFYRPAKTLTPDQRVPRSIRATARPPCSTPTAACARNELRLILDT